MRKSTPNAAAAESPWLAPSATASRRTSTPVAHTDDPHEPPCVGCGEPDAVGDTAPLIVEARPTSHGCHYRAISRGSHGTAVLTAVRAAPSPGQVASIRVRTTVATDPMSTASRSVASTCTTLPLRQDRLIRPGVVGQRIDAELRLDLMYLTARGPRLHPVEQDLGTPSSATSTMGTSMSCAAPANNSRFRSWLKVRRQRPTHGWSLVAASTGRCSTRRCPRRRPSRLRVGHRCRR